MTYKYSDVYDAVNVRVHNKLGILADARTTINTAVTEVTGVVDLRSMKRQMTLPPALFDDIYNYICPSDQKVDKAVDLQPQVMSRSHFQEWELCSEAYFDRYKQNKPNLITFTDKSGIRQMRVSLGAAGMGQGVSNSASQPVATNGQTITLDPLNSIIGNGGTWVVNGDAINLISDTYNYIRGNGSLRFDIGNGGTTTAGIQNVALTPTDITSFYQQGSLFVFAYITDPANISNYTAKLGSDASNYYTMVATQTNEQLTFQAGWNTLRFDFNGATITGTPVNTAIKYCSIFMTKTIGKINSTAYRFDTLQIKLGFIYNYIYYSKFPWQSNSGTWQAKSTADSDYLNLDEDEYNLVLEKVTYRCANAVKEYSEASSSKADHEELVKNYKMNWPSDALVQSDSTYDFASIDGDNYSYGTNQQ